ncbi:hypothetical protein TWF106_006562 [Orbilia oligospora]|uniref:L-type lectin-like domain-containing protein n=1 Tax=Orbilia oligospora TaxID=2813651 RepID=A0A6G1M0M8_ORBOL|nr:hypothetical protein TWF788_009943 [Orbilia oligospora]KAF3211782.1 hypothetical protein TWF679_006273 [Orbilia oligospora]KAF3220965.1 hypothetical protein TWF106_006562 [Orbilia oligospora]KAF3221938.1 hypothetical protein TWF191_006984 [Orbilia oligospora]KAF3240057.1 hypothetical protein TWF192_009593 [Orbilia oligospora]
MAPLRTWLPALGLWLLQAGHAHARAQGYTGADHPYKKEPEWDPFFTFGHHHPISHDGQKIDHFEVIGHPEILSDRVILTPPHPGNQRAAIWSDHSNHNEQWEFHVPFRASGPERAGGSLQIWYTYRGSSVTGTSSIYTAKPFDGLAIVIDSQGGRGQIRGYLNDGTTDYSIHHHPQSLAFGQCDAAYRNLGRPSDLKISYTHDHGLRVELDDHICFETNKIKLPSNYRWGVSAASAENPDSFELFGLKLALHKEWEDHHVDQHSDDHHEIHEDFHAEKESKNKNREKKGEKPREEEIQKRHKEAAEHHARMVDSKYRDFKSQYELKDEDATHFKDHDSQFTDLHLRMQALTHQLAEVQRVTGEISYNVGNMLDTMNEFFGHRDGGEGGQFEHTLKDIDRRMHHVDQTVQNLERSLRHEGDKINRLNEHHDNLHHKVKDAVIAHGPNMGFSVSLLVVFQVMLVIAYIVYKRRRSISPKKYL